MAPSAHAHNGALAFAVPLAGIHLDGDLADWPTGMTRYPIARLARGEKPNDHRDFHGTFRIGYNRQENALYVAVEVEDESLVADSEAPSAWYKSDQCEIYLDITHQIEDIPPFVSFIRGTRLASYSGPLVHLEGRGQQTASSHQYEWRLALKQAAGIGVELTPGKVLGIDIVVTDKDQDGSFSWMAWSPGAYKTNSNQRVGDIMCVKADQTYGRIDGTMRWKGNLTGVARGKVQLYTRASPNSSIRLATDRHGHFGAMLPVGEYRVGSGISRVVLPIPATIQVDVPVEVPLDISAPQGQKTPAGPGITLEAGNGRRQGKWHSLGLADGLLHAVISGVLQDRKGYMWFGTLGGGVSRYDGQRFNHLHRKGRPSRQRGK